MPTSDPAGASTASASASASASPESAPREACAGGIVFDDAGRLLLIRRGREPSLGLWSIPGGRCLPDEPSEEACVREVAEETGLAIEVIRLAGRVELSGPAGVRYDVDDFVCRTVGGTLHAGDDATDARWVTREELSGLPLAPGLVTALTEWNALPR